VVDGARPLCASCGKENEPGARFCSACGTPLEAETPSPENRKTVTLLFCDLAGSTSMGERLDSESVRRVMTQYFAAMRTAIERHGGTVEKFVGDAVMAVFGIPKRHEDDALRAVRAAADMRSALGELNRELSERWGTELEMRLGVNTGEVVAGDPSQGQSFVVGDPVNVTARLEQAAPPGGILLGEVTYRLVRDAVRAEPVEPLELKGKAQPVGAFRLLEVSPRAPGVARRLDSPLVGRDRELARLAGVFERVLEKGGCEVLTIVGPAGVGKSRLVGEFTGQLGERATVLQGRCLPYGEGITFWPLSEVVRQATAGELGSVERAQEQIAGLFGDDAEGAVIAERIAAALGLSDAPSTSEETFWAVRRLFEALARERPLVAIFDDIHWAEPTFLDLLDHLTDHRPERPVLLLLAARPELGEVRPGLAASEAVAPIQLEPLEQRESEFLIASLLGEGPLAQQVAGRVTEVAQGNPLFVEELLHMLADEGLLERREGRWTAAAEIGEISMPPTIQAVLGARLDRLGPDERTVTESASVVGQEFWQGAVSELAPERLSHEVELHLLALARKELVHPGEPTLDERTFRFAHILIRDAAYAGLLKQARAELHERFAAWMEHKAGERVAEYEEILGYHLEQAYRYLEELGPLQEHGRALGLEAARRLGAAGSRALRRGDMPAAASLLGRAVPLSAGAARRELMLKQGLALSELGEVPRACAVLDEAAGMAAAAEDRRVEVQARLERSYWRLATGPEGSTEELRGAAQEAIPVLEREGDEVGLARAWGHLAFVDSTACRWADAAQALERGIVHARRAEDPQQETELLWWLTGALHYGPTPVEEGVRRLEEILREMTEAAGGDAGDLLSAGNRAIVETTGLAGLEAMRGEFDSARARTARAKAIFEELGQTYKLAVLAQVSGWVELLAGDLPAAEDELRRSYEALEEIGDKGYLSTTAALLAEAVYGQGRYGEAESLTEVTESLAPADDVVSQVLWRATRAKALARRGESEQAEVLAREAVGLAAGTDDLNLHADRLMDRAELMRLVGRPAEALALVSQARELYRRKGNEVSMRKAAQLLG
jgi:class 3 adenylate cyclase